MVYRDLFDCSTVKNKGTCSNHARITREELESRVLNALRNELMDPALFQDFREEYTREINRLRMEASSDIAAKQGELERAQRGIRKIIEAIKEGYRTPGMKEGLFELEDRKERLTKELASAEKPPALLHPNMAREYRKRIDGLFEALKDEQTRLESGDDIRALVGRIVASPGQDDKANLWLEGDLAGIVTLAAGKKHPPIRRTGGR